MTVDAAWSIVIDMSGYAKLMTSILHSTIWLEDNHVRLVWITMLAMANRRGIVEASLPGLAMAARVPLDQCAEALERLLAPDPHSRTREHDGRRVEEIDGGWVLLNYAKYRAQSSRAAASERQAAWRSRKRAAVDAKRTAIVTETSTAGSGSGSGVGSGSEGVQGETGTTPADPMHRLWSPPAQRADVREAWDAWRSEFGKPGARLDHRRAEAIAQRLDEGATLGELQEVYRGARRDEWLASKGFQLTVILGDRERYEHCLELARGQVRQRERGPGPVQPTTAADQAYLDRVIAQARADEEAGL